MNKIFIRQLTCAAIALCGIMLASCQHTDTDLTQRALQLCQYIPDHKLQPEAQEFMTQDFYNALQESFDSQQLLPMDDEWLYTIVTGDGGTTPVYSVQNITRIDDTHATAQICVQQAFGDSLLTNEKPAVYEMQMLKSGDQWLIDDFDNKKSQCTEYLKTIHKEQAALQAINTYLIDSIGSQYSQGDVCIPCPIFTAFEENDNEALVYGDFWVYNYTISDDTLLFVSGGSHPGCMHLREDNGALTVAQFDRVTDGAGYLPSAKRIFGDKYDDFAEEQSDTNLKEVYRQQSVQEYVRSTNSDLKYYKDYGHEAVSIF